MVKFTGRSADPYPQGPAPAGVDMSRDSQSGFTLIEAAIAAFLVVIFFLAFASSVDIAVDNTRGNRFSQQATGIVSQEMEYGRVLAWDELAMSSVDSGAPMLNPARTHLLASAAGLESDEELVVESAGLVTPSVSHTVDGQEFQVWRYVTDPADGLRRLVVLITWDIEGSERTFQTSTLISEVTAGDDPGGSTTTSTSTTTTSEAPGCDEGDGDDGDDDDDDECDDDEED